MTDRLLTSEQGTTVGQMKEDWRREVDEASKRSDIMVGSLNMWPICAASAFVDACQRLEARGRQIEDRDQALQSMGSKLERLRDLVRAIHDETCDNARHFSADSYLPIHLRQRIEAALDE